jgi:hypothetical protein
MLWKLVLAYLLALPAVLWIIDRLGQWLGASPRDSIRARVGVKRRPL